MIGLTVEHRNEVIEFLVMWTGWAASAFEKMTDKELLALYDRHRMRG